jgi:hypothetical protein
MLFCEEMRRSSIWFLIAGLWLIDAFLTAARGHTRQAWLPAVITVAFVAAGIIHRSREANPSARKRIK